MKSNRMNRKILKVYEGKCEISIPPPPRYHITMPCFKPLDTENLSFRFEAMHSEYRDQSTFQLKLLKISSDLISPTLEATVDVKVNYADGSLLCDYPTTPLRKVNDLRELRFADVDRNLFEVREKFIVTHKMTLYDNDYSKGASRLTRADKLFDFVENIKSMYDPAELCDFIFEVRDKSFSSHKFILAAHSPVFKKMFAHEFLESKTNSVTISDASPEIFGLFLKYLYTGEIGDMSWNTLKDLYYLAHKYDVAFLKKQCTVSIISMLSVDLVCKILQLALAYSDEYLKCAAIEFSVDHIKEVVTRDDWKELVQTNSMIVYELSVKLSNKA